MNGNFFYFKTGILVNQEAAVVENSAFYKT